MDTKTEKQKSFTPESLALQEKIEETRAIAFAHDLADAIARISEIRDQRSDGSGGVDLFTHPDEILETHKKRAAIYSAAFERMIKSEFTEIMTFNLTGAIHEDENGGDRDQEVSVQGTAIYGLNEDRRCMLKRGLQGMRDRIVEESYDMREQRAGIAKLASALGLNDGDDEGGDE